MHTLFDPTTLADDLHGVHGTYARLFAGLDVTMWDVPSQRGRKEWTLHETIAHLTALNGAGLASVKHTLRGEPYAFDGLESRYQLNAWNRKGIDELLSMPRGTLCAEFLRVHGDAAAVACSLQAGQGEITARMPIYNRPVQIVEALSIIIMHAALIHTAQVAEPAGVPPLWMQLTPELRHRLIGRVMRAFSLLYRLDIGGRLRAAFVFRVDAPGGGEWHVDVSPEGTTSGEGGARPPALVLRFQESDDFCRMLTGRLNLPRAIVSRRLKPSGDLRLFLRMSKLFSPDARP
jgi:hypothetical protein